MPSVFPPVEAGSITELATALGIEPRALDAAVAEFNRSVSGARFDPGSLDGASAASAGVTDSGGPSLYLR